MGGGRLWEEKKEDRGSEGKEMREGARETEEKREMVGGRRERYERRRIEGGKEGR